MLAALWQMVDWICQIFFQFSHFDVFVWALTLSLFEFVKNNVKLFELREEARCACETAIQRSAPNPTRTVERTSITTIVLASSQDAATSTTTPRSLAARFPQVMKQVDRSKGKEPAHAATKTKRTREGEDVEPERKRTSQVLRLADSAWLRFGPCHSTSPGSSDFARGKFFRSILLSLDQRGL